MKKKIKEIVTLIGGFAFKSDLYTQSGLRIIRIANVQDGYITDDYPCYYPLSLTDSVGSALLKKDDLLMSLTGNVGRVAFLTEDLLPAVLNQRVECLRTDDLLLKRYLYYFFRSKEFVSEAINNSSGIAQLNMSAKWLGNYEIDIPKREIMKKICDELNNLSILIDTKRNQLKLLDELIKSRFIEMFGDPISNTKNLKTKEVINVVTLQRGFDLPIHLRKRKGDIPLYGSNGIIDYHVEAKCDCGIITGRSGTIGKVYYSEKPFWPLNTTLFSINCHNNNIIYLSYLLEFFDLTRFCAGSGVPTLNRNNFHNEQIIDVEKNQQEQFAAFVKLIDKSKFIVRKEIELLQELLDSKMNEYFSDN